MKRLLTHLLVRLVIALASASPGIAQADSGSQERSYFRACSSTGTIASDADEHGVSIRVLQPAATSVPFRLEWCSDLLVTGAWDVVAMASASNTSGRVDYILPIANPDRIRWSNSFENAAWTQEWGVLADKNWGWTNLERVVATGDLFETFVRAHYPSNSCSPACTNVPPPPEGGGQFLATAGLAPTNALHLRYYVRFHTNLNFVKGGKLPGLFGGTSHFSGGAIPDGTNGFSTRYMWRTNGTGEVYAYLPTSLAYGTEIGRGRWRFRQGEWCCLEQRVVLNTPGSDGGRIVVWVDGKMLIDERNVRFRTTDTLMIRGIFFSTFFGGDDPTWATPVDTYADFAGFVLSTSYIGP